MAHLQVLSEALALRGSTVARAGRRKTVACLSTLAVRGLRHKKGACKSGRRSHEHSVSALH
jgi:hypothetical protein